MGCAGLPSGNPPDFVAWFEEHVENVAGSFGRASAGSPTVVLPEKGDALLISRLG